MESHGGNQIPPHVRTDLGARFIVNIPEEHLKDHTRIMFEVENAHWYYLDFFLKQDDCLPKLGLKEFARQMYHHLHDILPPLEGGFDCVYKFWTEYKWSVPTFGAILLDPEMKNCLMVQHYSGKPSWGFPKGKVNEAEAPEKCAIREVLEEVGFDCSSLLKPDVYYEYTRKYDDAERKERLYYVVGIPIDTKFQTRTRQEIKKIKWFEVDALPTVKHDQNTKSAIDYNATCFHMVLPFIKELRRWIKRQKFDQQQHQRSQKFLAQQEAERRQQNFQRQQQLYMEGNMNEYTEYMAMLQRKQPPAREEGEKELKQRGRGGGQGGERESRQRAPGAQAERESRQRGERSQKGHQQSRTDTTQTAPQPQVQIMQRDKFALPYRGNRPGVSPLKDERSQSRRSADRQRGTEDRQKGTEDRQSGTEDRQKGTDGNRQKADGNRQRGADSSRQKVAEGRKPKNVDSDRQGAANRDRAAVPDGRKQAPADSDSLPELWSHSWENFKFDVDAIFAAMGWPKPG